MPGLIRRIRRSVRDIEEDVHFREKHTLLIAQALRSGYNEESLRVHHAGRSAL